MAQWQITPGEYLKRLELNIEDFEKKLQLPQVNEVTKIIPLRELHKIESIVPIGSDLLLYLIRRIRTLDGQMPFTNSTIRQVVVNPNQPKIGQKYVYRENYQQLLENISGIFNPLLGEWGGLGNLGAYFVFGYNSDNKYSMACYIPPIIEVHKSKPLIMDGIHRNYIARQTGLTINALIVKNVSIPFPCSPKNWNEIQVISLSNKPKNLEDRYFELQKGLFRDLKYLGIDG
jgi:hypothetical protein